MTEMEHLAAVARDARSDYYRTVAAKQAAENVFQRARERLSKAESALKRAALEATFDSPEAAKDAFWL